MPPEKHVASNGYSWRLYLNLLQLRSWQESHLSDQALELLTSIAFAATFVSAAHRLIVMAGDWVGPDLVFGGMSTFFIITGILSLRDAASGGC